MARGRIAALETKVVDANTGRRVLMKYMFVDVEIWFKVYRYCLEEA